MVRSGSSSVEIRSFKRSLPRGSPKKALNLSQQLSQEPLTNWNRKRTYKRISTCRKIDMNRSQQLNSVESQRRWSTEQIRTSLWTRLSIRVLQRWNSSWKHTSRSSPQAPDRVTQCSPKSVSKTSLRKETSLEFMTQKKRSSSRKSRLPSISH